MTADNRPIIVSFSGGRSSALMAYLLCYHPKYAQRTKYFIMANTGREMSETFTFARNWADYCGFSLSLVEAVTHHDARKGCTHQLVSWDTLSMKGEPYRDMVAKYGLPNLNYPHCTRELKANPIRSFIRQVLKLKKGEYVQAIGMRFDEIGRMVSTSRKETFIYPLIDLRIAKQQVNDFFTEESRAKYNLPLESWEGNCDFCFKKSWNNLRRMYSKHPDRLTFWSQLETEFSEGDDQMYRGHRMAADLKADIIHEDKQLGCACMNDDVATMDITDPDIDQ